MINYYKYNMVDYYLIEELYNEENASWQAIYLYDRFEREEHELYSKYY